MSSVTIFHFDWVSATITIWVVFGMGIVLGGTLGFVTKNMYDHGVKWKWSTIKHIK